MRILGCILFWNSIFISASAIFVLLLIKVKTKQVTEFLAVTNWFGFYSKISQKIKRDSDIVKMTRVSYKNKPIREEISEFGRLFREDFEDLFAKLEPGVHYRVVTHYSGAIRKAVDEHKIVLIDEPKLKTRRLLSEIKPLVSRKDYRLIKRCFRKKPNIERCCENCEKRKKCQCRKGGSCKLAILKKFYEYNFVITDNGK